MIPDPTLHRWTEVWRINPTLHSAGWDLGRFIGCPEYAIATVCFPPEPADPADYLPLLPAQALAAMAADRTIPMATSERSPEPQSVAWDKRSGPTIARLERISPTGPHPISLRDGTLVEPLAHRQARGPNRHDNSRPLERIRSARIARALGL